jgi:uncharacterized protein (DUF2147 family)
MTRPSQHLRNIALTATFWALTLATSASGADPVTGTWQTEPGDTGGYLHVKIDPCADRICGVILRAFDKDGAPVEDYEHLGKPMITKMRRLGDGRYGKGRIWAPDKNKTYKSKMRINDGKLIVEGCIAFICRSQIWKPVPSG